MNKHKWFDEIVHFYSGGNIQFINKDLYSNDIGKKWRDWDRNWKETPMWDSSYYSFRIKSEPHQMQYLVDAIESNKDVQYKIQNGKEWHTLEMYSRNGFTINSFRADWEWRIKPEDIVRFVCLDHDMAFYPYFPSNGTHNVKIVWDGDTKELKEVRLMNKGETRP